VDAKINEIMFRMNQVMVDSDSRKKSKSEEDEEKKKITLEILKNEYGIHF